jgi:glutamate dehydrogenase (NADP+)
MSQTVKAEVQKFMRGLIKRNPGESEFHQAVEEVVETLVPFVQEHPRYSEANILERMTEPDRVVIFRVCWEDDARTSTRRASPTMRSCGSASR